MSEYPEPLYDVDKIGEQAKVNNQHLKRGKRMGTRNAKTRGCYSFGDSGGEDILFSRPQKYICMCGFSKKSAFKKCECDKCGLEMELEEKE